MKKVLIAIMLFSAQSFAGGGGVQHTYVDINPARVQAQINCSNGLQIAVSNGVVQAATITEKVNHVVKGIDTPTLSISSRSIRMGFKLVSGSVGGNVTIGNTSLQCFGSVSLPHAGL